MKSNVIGKDISNVEVVNISLHGVWILFERKEYFLPFEEYPWFRDARISEIQNVKKIHKNHFYWPDLDVDLSTNILLNLESYPLKYK